MDLLQAALPTASAIVATKIPENPVVLKMKIAVDETDTEPPAANHNGVDKASVHANGQAVNAKQYVTSIEVTPWTDADSQTVWSHNA